MEHPPIATHMVSLPGGELHNNELGYCSSTSRNPNAVVSLMPLGTGWSKWTLRGTSVVVKWLQLAGEPEFLHVLDGETSTTSRLPRRLLERSPADVVTIRTASAEHHPADTVLYYGTASSFEGEVITVTPLQAWRYDLPAGAAVEISNLSDPSNPVKSGKFGLQSSVKKGATSSAQFLKDSPAGS